MHRRLYHLAVIALCLIGNCAFAQARLANNGAHRADQFTLAYSNLTGIAQGKLLGRGASSGTGAAELITVGSGLSMAGTTLSATGGGVTAPVTIPSAAVDSVPLTVTCGAGQTANLQYWHNTDTGYASAIDAGGGFRTYYYNGSPGAYILVDEVYSPTYVNAVNGFRVSNDSGNLGTAGLSLSSAAVVAWSGGYWYAGTDTALERGAAGMVKVTSGIQYTTGTRPTCSSDLRGATWYVAGGTGVADTFEVCAKASADTYSWTALATIP